ncbi:MAG: hypothetical protein MJZ97_07010 [Bacteroidales bacterium]|nr:hypothetical protein [Bacteroidales bacterium]
MQDDFDEMKILVLTRHDDCCGPMAAAFLRDYSQKLEVVSAGIHPAENIKPLVVAAMKECLVDLSAVKPNAFGNCEQNAFDYILLIGVPADFCQIDAAKTVSLNPEIVACDLDSMRLLRDWIKNEVFIVYKPRFR